MASPIQATPLIQQKTGLDLLEQFVKIGSGVLVLIYAVGFLIVSIHHALYGIVMFEFLRPRAFAAGILWVLFLGSPLSAVRSSMVRRNASARFWRRASLFAVLTCIWLFGFAPFMAGLARVDQFIWWLPFSLSTFIFALWFLSVAILSAVLSRYKLRFRPDEWTMLVIFGMAAIVVFAGFVYGRVLPSWGGGLPARVTMHFSHKTAFAESLAVPAYMVDETERGYYLIHKPEDRNASFIPREAVASVDF